MNPNTASHFSFDVDHQEVKPKYLLYTEAYLPAKKNHQPSSTESFIESQFDQGNPTESLLNPQRSTKWKADLYEYSFNTGIFIKTLIFYILYFFLLGPLILILRCLLKLPILSNLIMPTIRQETFVLLAGFVFPLGYLSFIRDDFGILMPSVIALYMNIVFVIVAQASMTAFTNKNVSELFTLVILSESQVKALKKVEIADELLELRNTFNRLKINVASLYFNFMEDKGDLPETLKKKVQEEDMTEYLVKDGLVYLPKLVTKENLVQEALNLEKGVFEKKCFGQRTHLDEKKMLGYNLAIDIVVSGRQEISKKMRKSFYLMGMAQAWAIEQGEIRRVAEYPENVFVLSVVCWLFYVSMAVIVYYIIDILCMALLNLKRRMAYMLKLGKLITLGGEELNLNVFDYMSLRTWVTLRKAFMHYGDRQMETIGLIMTLFITSHIIVGALLFLDYMHVLKILSDEVRPYVMTFFVGGQFFVIFLIMIVYQAVSINKQYHAHKELIRKNRAFVVSMYRLYPNYIAKEQPLEPESLIQVQALKLLREEFGDCEYKEKMESQLKVLMETYDEILKDLEFEEVNYPIRLVGISITPNLIKTLGTAAVSAGFASLVKYISNLTSK